MFQRRFSYSALSSQHFRPLLITPLLANSLEVQAHCLRNGELAPHPLVSCSTAGSGFNLLQHHRSHAQALLLYAFDVFVGQGEEPGGHVVGEEAGVVK